MPALGAQTEQRTAALLGRTVICCKLDGVAEHRTTSLGLVPVTVPHPATMPDGPAPPLPSSSPGKEDARKEKLRKAGQEYFEKVLAQVTCPHCFSGSLRTHTLARL